jgi:gluconate 2-dehydrogenase alpha chain
VSVPERAEAVVVGLGAAGGIIAEQLATAGLQVVALDKGPAHGEDELRFKHDEIRYYSRGALVPQLSTDPITWRPNEQTTARLLPWADGALGTSEPLHLPPSVGVGGGTLHWGGACWRHRAADFRMRSTIEERHGSQALDEDSTMVDWPIGYDDLEPYYDRVEWQLGVSGQAGNVDGELQAGGNHHEAPRRRGYPMPPLRRAAADERFVAACLTLGLKPFPQPAAIASVDYGELEACVYCGFCHGYLCHVGAKQSSAVTCVRRALATGNLDVRPLTRVLHVNRDQGRVRGVAYVGPDGTAGEVEAELVVLACYALENTRLLLVSGINASGEVGRHFMTHSFGWATGVLPEYCNPFMGPLVGASIVDDYQGELVPDNDDGVVWGSVITSFPGDTQPIEAAHSLPPHLPRWGKAFKHWLTENYRRLFSMHNQIPTFPSRSHYCDLDPEVRDPWGQPALRITHDWSRHDLAALRYFSPVKRRIADAMGALDWWEEPSPPRYHLSTHEAGTHRMGENPATSVVDPFGESHECAGLYVVGGGQFPTLAGYNPTETLQALAYLSADHMLDRA